MCFFAKKFKFKFKPFIWSVSKLCDSPKSKWSYFNLDLIFKVNSDINKFMFVLRKPYFVSSFYLLLLIISKGFLDF